MSIVDRRRSVSGDTAIKAPCRAATTSNLTLAGQQTVDGVACVEGDRVLVKNQSLGTENGIYAASTGNWTRERDFDGAFDIVKGTLVRVTNGSVNIGYWEVTTSNPITVDSTSVAFAITTNSISGVSSYFSTLLSSVSATALFQSFIDAITLRGLLDMLTAAPAGVIHAYAGATAPTGYLLCYGQAVSRTTYAALFAITGTFYGVGDGTTTFNLPDLRGRTVAAPDNMGGSTANRLVGGDLAAVRHTLGGAGGVSTHTLTTAQIESHTHTFTGSALAPHSHTVSGVDAASAGAAGGANFLVGASVLNTSSVSAGTPAGTNSSTGGGGAHNNVQPTILLNYIIKI